MFFPFGLWRWLNHPRGLLSHPKGKNNFFFFFLSFSVWPLGWPPVAYESDSATPRPNGGSMWAEKSPLPFFFKKEDFKFLKIVRSRVAIWIVSSDTDVGFCKFRMEKQMKVLFSYFFHFRNTTYNKNSNSNDKK